MATSDSDGFASADEELADSQVHRKPLPRARECGRSPNATIDSESDDDNECCGSPVSDSPTWCTTGSPRRRGTRGPKPATGNPPEITEKTEKIEKTDFSPGKKSPESKNPRGRGPRPPGALKVKGSKEAPPKLAQKLPTAEKLPQEKSSVDLETASRSQEDPGEACDETPEELKSDKKFKEIFGPQGGAETSRELADRAIFSEFGGAGTPEDATLSRVESPGWSAWGNWGVGDLFNSAAAGVAAVADRVTHGLTLLDEAIGAPSPEEFARKELTETKAEATSSETPKDLQEPNPGEGSFGFPGITSGMESVRRRVESTGLKVLNGGLETLEQVGKLTMLFLEDIEPRLKRKRAFFEDGKLSAPCLSRSLLEAKKDAELLDGFSEDDDFSRKFLFDKLFDEHAGVRSLQQLEEKSKKANCKIQEILANLEAEKIAACQETLEEVQILCELEDDDELEEEDKNFKLKDKIQALAGALNGKICYDGISEIWEETTNYVKEGISAPEVAPNDRQVFERAISDLAKLAALSVRYFLETGALLEAQEPPTVLNVAEALVQLARISMRQIDAIANLFTHLLDERAQNRYHVDKSLSKTIVLEAEKANSYVEHALKISPPILQWATTRTSGTSPEPEKL